MPHPFLASLALIGLAELGDKTQLLGIALYSRYGMRTAAPAVLVSTGLLMAIAVLLGDALTSIAPMRYAKLVAGLLFMAFGVVSLKTGGVGSGRVVMGLGPFTAAFTAFFLAELGDKTQFAAFALAARFENALYVWLGSTLGMAMANCAGIALVRRYSGRYPLGSLERASGALFILFGLFTLIEVALSSL